MNSLVNLIRRRLSFIGILLALAANGAAQTNAPAASSRVDVLKPCSTSTQGQDLFAAIKRKDARRVAALLAQGVSANARSQINWRSYDDDEASCTTALMYAARLGDAGTVNALLAGRPDLNARDNRGRLVWAYAFGDRTMRRTLQLLRESHEEVASEYAAQLQAEMNARLQIVKVLLAAGANPRAMDQSGESALRHAVDAGVLGSDARILKLLIAAGAQLKGKDAALVTHATHWRRVEAERAETRKGAKAPEAEAVIEALLAAGADVNAPLYGETALIFEAEAWRQEGVVRRLQVLLAAGANVNAPDEIFGKTPLLGVLKSYQGYSYGERVQERGFAETLKDKVAVIKLLLAAGADPNRKDKQGESAITATFFPYLMTNYPVENEAIVKALVAAGADLNARDPKGRTLLALVASERFADDYFPRSVEGRIRLLKTLIESGADVNAANHEKQTPLVLAIKSELSDLYSERTFKALIEAGANLNASDAHGRTPLMEAIQNYRQALVKTLLEARVDVNMRAADGSSALLVSLARGLMPETTKLLIEAGADVNAADLTGRTPLLAAVSTSLGSLPPLLEAKADVNAKDRNGDTALMLAARLGREEAIVKALLAAGADPSAVNNDGDSALIIAARRFSPSVRTYFSAEEYTARNNSIIAALLAAGAPAAAVDAAGESALTIMAAKAGAPDLPIMRGLIVAGQRERKRDYPGAADLIAAIRRAAGHSKSEIVEELIAASADPNSEDEQGRPALLVAVSDAGNALVVRALLRAGAQVNARDGDGDTALLAAVRAYLPGGDEFLKNALHRDAAVVRELLAAHADLKARDKDGNTALTLARRSGNLGIIGLLETAGRQP